MKLTELKSSSFGWQFLDENEENSIFSEVELNKLVLLGKMASREYWEYYISVQYFHLMKIPAQVINNKKWIERDYVDWNNANEKFPSFGFKKNEKSIFLNGPNEGIILEWSIFLKYWKNFFYTSDDNIVILFPEINRFLTYIEGVITLYPLEENFVGDLNLKDNKRSFTKKEDENSAPYKTHQGKTYTKEEWEAFEQEQWEKYKKGKK